MSAKTRLQRPMVHRGAFSLIEMMVVVGIIVMLVGLTITVATSIHARAEINQTDHLLTTLDQALREWEVTAERQISYGANGTPPGAVYDVQEDAPDEEDGELDIGSGAQPQENDFRLTRQVLAIIRRNPQVESLLRNVSNDLLKPPPPGYPLQAFETSETLRVYDPWDKEIMVVFPGRLWNASIDAASIKDLDGTIFTEFEEALGRCAGRRIYFVSAGPDGKFGDLKLNVAMSSLSNDAAVQAAADNIHSSKPLMDRDQPTP